MANKIYFIILILFAGCNESKELSPIDYMHWFEDRDNKCIQTKEFKDIVFNVQYKTPDYILLKEMDEAGLNSGDVFEMVSDKKKDISGMQYFTFRILSADKQSSVLKTKGYSNEILMDRLSYISYDIQKDFTVVSGEDTLPCVLFNYVRNYDLAPTLDFVLAFPLKGHETDDKLFVYDDKLFGMGSVKFLFDKEMLTQIPTLKK